VHAHEADERELQQMRNDIMSQVNLDEWKDDPKFAKYAEELEEWKEFVDSKPK
jgi:hypothetical protein